MDLSHVISTAALMALVLCRIGGFIVISPFPGAWIPKKPKVALLISLAFTVGLSMPENHELRLDMLLLPAAVNDFFVGLMIGGTFRFVLSAADFMAGMVSQASWLSAPVSMNPEMGGQSQVMTQVSSLLALMVALSAGVHRVVIAYLLESFHALPVASEMNVYDGLLPFVDLVGQSFDMGMRLALPVVAVSLAVQTALALVSRVAPSLQIFSIGFGVLVATGLITFMASLESIAAGVLQYTNVVSPFLDDILTRVSEVQ